MREPGSGCAAKGGKEEQEGRKKRWWRWRGQLRKRRAARECDQLAVIHQPVAGFNSKYSTLPTEADTSVGSSKSVTFVVGDKIQELESSRSSQGEKGWEEQSDDDEEEQADEEDESAQEEKRYLEAVKKDFHNMFPVMVSFFGVKNHKKG